MFSTGFIEFVIPEPQEVKLCLVLRGSVCVIFIVYLPSPCQHRTWYQIWHGTAKKQQAIVQIGCEWSFLVRPKYTYTKAKRTNSRQDEQAHTLLNSVPVFHIFDFSNREEDLKDKIRLPLASSQNKLKIFSQWPMFIIVEQLQVGKNDEYFRLARVLKRNNMRSDWSTSPGESSAQWRLNELGLTSEGPYQRKISCDFAWQLHQSSRLFSSRIQPHLWQALGSGGG